MIIYTYLSQQQIWHKKLFSERRCKQQSCQNTSKDLSFYPINCGVNEFCISYLTAESVSYYSLYSVTISKSMVYPQISTTEETFQSQLIDTTIFQTKSFDVLSEFALLVSCTPCSAYSAVLSCESEKMSQRSLNI